MGFLTHCYRFLVSVGIDPVRMLHALRGLPYYVRDWRDLRRQRPETDSGFRISSLYPCLGDRFGSSGDTKGHYFLQDLLVARWVYENNPQDHVDIGSRIDGFVAHVAAFRPVEVMDIRPLDMAIPQVTFRQLDFMQPVGEELHAYCDSISCLHAIEHFGLGRYGDPVDYYGFKAGLDNLTALLKPGGRLYLSVPIGPQRIEFNAHRVFSVGYLLELFEACFETIRFSYIDDHCMLHEEVALSTENVKTSFDCTFGCGIFELKKR